MKFRIELILIGLYAGVGCLLIGYVGHKTHSQQVESIEKLQDHVDYYTTTTMLKDQEIAQLRQALADAQTELVALTAVPLPRCALCGQEMGTAGRTIILEVVGEPRRYCKIAVCSKCFQGTHRPPETCAKE